MRYTTQIAAKSLCVCVSVSLVYILVLCLFLRYFLLFVCFVLRSAKTRRQHAASLTRLRLKCNGRAAAAAVSAAAATVAARQQ